MTGLNAFIIVLKFKKKYNNKVYTPLEEGFFRKLSHFVTKKKEKT